MRGQGGDLITSTPTTTFGFMSPETNIYVFMLFKNRGRTKCQKCYVDPIL